MEREYVAFISYRHARLDSAVAKTLHTLIEQYRIPKGVCPRGRRRLGLVFRDNEELHTSSDLSGEIQNALRSSEFLIVVCSENTAQSPWVSREIGHFLENHDRKHILTVLASGEPGDVFPEQLTHVEQPDGTVQIIEPLALDARASSLGGMRRKLRKEIARLISAMLDCPYDALVLREQKRKFRRFSAIAALVLAVVLSFTGMVVAKNKEIAQKNTELALQKSQIQLRESELLAKDAREALEQGNIVKAISGAVAALPKAQEPDRPYYAPAEGVLMEALNLFHCTNDSEYLSCVDMEQDTPISDFGISAAGHRAVTLDSYGGIRCYDTATGNLCWSTQLPALSGGSWNQAERIIMTADENRLLVLYHGNLAAFSLDAGAQLWQRSVVDIKDGYLFYNAESDTLTYGELIIGQTDVLRLVFLSAQTGQELGIVPVAQGQQVYLYSFNKSSQYRDLACGVFSEEGSVFVGTFLDENSGLHFFRAEPATQTSEILYSHSTPVKSTFAIVDMVLDDQSLLIAATGMAENTAMSLLKLDTQTGELISQWDIPAWETFFATKSYAFLFQTAAVIGIYDQVAVVSMETGEILGQFRLSDSISHMCRLENRFGIALDDGTYALAWANTDGNFTITSNAFLGVSADVGKHSDLKVWGGGIVQMNFEGGGFFLGVSNINGPGAVALIPKESEKTLRFYKPITLEAPVPLQAIQSIGEDISTSYSFLVQQLGDSLFFGPVHSEDPETGEKTTLTLILDKDTLEIRNQLLLGDEVYSSGFHYLPDGSGWVRQDFSGDIYLGNADASEMLLISKEETGPGSSVSTYLSGGSELLSAWCGSDTLSLWRNGRDRTDIPLPEELVCDLSENYLLNRLLTAGTNGYLLAGFHEEDVAIPLNTLAGYDTAEGLWTFLTGDVLFHPQAIFALAQEKALAAGMDEEGVLQVFDLRTGAIHSSIPLSIPVDSVKELQFLPDDTCLLVVTEDNTLYIYDIASRSLRFRDQLDGAAWGVTAYHDTQNQRLYLMTSRYYESNGICIELNSWTKLDTLQNALYFDNETQNLFCYRNLFLGGRSFVYFRVPDTAELVKLGQQRIG